VAALKQRPPTPQYRGIFEDGPMYAAGSLVTKAGSLWLATRDTATVPGSGPSSGWTLIVKNGAKMAPTGRTADE
jgi:hypothetical protein